MAEMMMLNLPVEKDLFEQAQASFKKRGLDLHTEMRGFLARCLDDNIVYLENGEWYNSDQMTYEEYLLVKEALDEEEANPDDWCTLEEGFLEIRRMLDEKVQNKNANTFSERHEEYS